MTATGLRASNQTIQPRHGLAVVAFAGITILVTGLVIGLARPASQAAAEYAPVPPDRGVVIGTFNAEYAPVPPDRGVVIGTFGAAPAIAGTGVAAAHLGRELLVDDFAAPAIAGTGVAAAHLGRELLVDDFAAPAHAR